MAMVLPTGSGVGNTWDRMSATRESPAPTTRVTEHGLHLQSGKSQGCPGKDGRQDAGKP